VRLTHERFRTDTQALITALQNALEEVESLRRQEGEGLYQAKLDDKRRLEEGKEGEQSAKAPVQAQRDAEARGALRRKHAQASGTMVASKAMVASSVCVVMAGWIIYQWLPHPFVTGPERAIFEGPEGGPFSPPSIAFRVKDNGRGFYWSTKGPQWFDFVPSDGDLTPGASAEIIVVPNAAARSLKPKRYLDTLEFHQSDGGPGLRKVPKVDRRDVVLRVLAAKERTFRPKDAFKECDKCPETIVVPAGSFTMGSSARERAARTTKARSTRLLLHSNLQSDDSR
jgi:hypothetical protein